jgi:CrcB protein
MLNFIYVFIGGGLGSTLRYFITLQLAKPFTYKATLLANFLSCLIAGIIFYVFHTHKPNQTLNALLIAGFCGGFSTMSAFSLDNLQFILNKQTAFFLAYSLITYILCLSATLGGYLLTKQFYSHT